MVVFNRRRIKSIDCKLIGVLIEDALRAKTVEQLNDDNFIFIRRAVDTQERARLYIRKQKRSQQRKGLAEAHEPLSEADFYEKSQARKRNKNTV